MNRTLLSIIVCLICMCTGISVRAQVADFDIDGPDKGCAPFATAFKDKSSGAITSWYWEFGDGKTAAIPKPSKTYLDPGVYTVKLTVKTATGASSSKTKTITVQPSPKISFTASPVAACPCTQISFTNTSLPMAPGSYTSKWSFGDGNTAVGKDTRYTYCSPGTYNVALQVTNSFGCTSARVDTAKVTIYTKPSVSITTTKKDMCRNPDSTVFSAYISGGKSPYTYDWDFGDGRSSPLPNPVHIYATGTYTVKLIVTDANGCKDTVVQKDMIKSVLPRASFVLPASICAGANAVIFEDVSTPASATTDWTWSDGGGASGKVAIRNFWEGGNYTIKMISTSAGGCKDTITKVYTVYPKPRAVFSYSPIYPCPAPAKITFTNKSRGADSFTWIFGDGTTSKLKNDVHTYTRDSIYTVFLIARSSFGCLDTFRVRDTTKPFPMGYPRPYYDSTNSPVIIRVYQGKAVIKVDTADACLPVPAKFRVSIFTSTRLPVATDTGLLPRCIGVPGYMSPPYWNCFVTPFPDPYPDEFYDPPSTPSPWPYPYPARRWFWEFGDGTTSTSDTPSHLYTAEGSYLVKVTVYTDSCSFTDTFRVQRGLKPHANFVFNPPAICTNNLINLTNLSTNALKIYWDFGDSYTSNDTGKYQIHFYRDVVGDRTITLTAERFGCLDSMQKTLIIHPPGSSFGFRYSCDTPLKVSFTDSSYRATGVLWDFGDGSPFSPLRNPVHTYSAPGSYMVSLMTVNDTFGCRDTLSRAIRVFYPDLSFKALDTAVCLGKVVSFMANLRDIYKSYVWHTGTEWKVDSAGRLPYTYKDTGNYTITLIGEDIHNCYDTAVRKRYILVAKPQMKAVATPLVGCAPLSVLFRDLSTDTKGAYVTTRKWLFGDATSPRTTTFDTVNHVYPAGNYNVMLVATDNIGCIDSMKLNIESRRPVVEFISNVDTIACRGHIVSFYNRSAGPGLSFRWSFGDGGTSTDKDPTHVYTSFGSFSVKLVVTDASGCKDSLTKEGFIRTQSPKADFDVSDSVALCPPLFVSFTNKSSPDAVGRLWNFDNGSSSSVDNPTAPYLDAGVYTIVLVVTDRLGCTDTARKKVRVFGYDGALKYGPLKGCAPLSVDFEAEMIKAEVMIWDFADGITESSPGKYKTTHVYTRPGTYVPQMILGDGHGCTASSRGRDTIRVDGIEPRIVTSPACIGVDITVSDSSTSPFSDYASSEWLLDDGNVEKSRTITRRYAKAGTYPLRLISANTNGCIDTIYYDLIVHDLPQISVADTVICLNDAATLMASGGVSYEWTPDPTLSCTDCPVAMANPKVRTAYYVTGTDANGCKNKDTVTVGIKTKTRMIMPGDTNVCAQTPIRLEVSGAQRYTWIPPLYLDDATKSNPVAILDTTITYIVIGREGSCIPDTGKIRILVHPLPEVNAGDDQRVLAGSMVTLNGSGQRVKDYLWQPGDSLDCATCPNTQYRARVTTTFTLKGVTDHGCVDSDDVIIIVFCDQSQLFIPNTFTPNGDGQNDVFYPRGSGVGKIKALRIYNRWGQLVFERLNMDVNAAGQGWDGSFKNEQLNPDVYVYTLEATCDTGEQIFWKGDVTIIR